MGVGQLPLLRWRRTRSNISCTWSQSLLLILSIGLGVPLHLLHDGSFSYVTKAAAQAAPAAAQTPQCVDLDAPDWCPELEPVPNGYRRIPSRRAGAVGFLNCLPGYRITLGNFFVCDRATRQWKWSSRTLFGEYEDRESGLDLGNSTVVALEQASAAARNFAYSELQVKCEKLQTKCDEYMAEVTRMESELKSQAETCQQLRAQNEVDMMLACFLRLSDLYIHVLSGAACILSPSHNDATRR